MNENLKAAKTRLIKEAIVKAAKKIIEEDGLASLSIRNLAEQIGYSPAAIYQYYDSKAQIVSAVIRDGYHEIINSIQSENSNFQSAEEEIRHKLKIYIKNALENKNYYRAVMMSEDKNVLQFTKVLNKQTHSNQSAIQFLVNLIEKGQKQDEFLNNSAEILAKSIWTATFGLIIRMIIENIDDQQRQNELIENQLQLIFDGIRKK
ncbi:TetR/AcrR family transcriptional regulator [Halanaerobium sp. ST460_2HS_T2]|uniref:TetR/AcrR family transcriptional regulator n=1 Tax=Halanaerobium sp. ST460_2HS_T2 TaxID=2183914 RepID=UPI000DF1F8C7|nr:helix-turn-helix domain-containing protein [Halanaerobium sp. ST460_2HS_T2]RCW60930.1 TetR family transcriptional regulator [Halanaerobium sp. ST460_2HS_T2]